MLVNVILVTGLYIFVGNSGVFSFGHIAFAAVGAYCAAILAMEPKTKKIEYPDMWSYLQRIHVPDHIDVVAGGLMATALALIVVAPLMRLSGLTAGLASFAVLIIVNVTISNLTVVTNGTIGLYTIPVKVDIGVALAWATFAIIVAYCFQQTQTCHRIRAAREDEIAARAIGVRIARNRAVALCLSAFVVGIGGALFAKAQSAIDPRPFFLSLTFLTLAMLVVGGIASLTGAVVGTILLSAVSETFSRAEGGFSVLSVTVPPVAGLRSVALALVMLLVLILRPDGLTRGREITWPFRPKHERPDAATAWRGIADPEIHAREARPKSGGDIPSSE
jgi:branched-chain amino acid transport system permease protein